MMPLISRSARLAACFLTLLLGGGSAHAEESLEQGIARTLVSAYPLLLAKVGVWKSNPADLQTLANRSAKALAAVAPENCKAEVFKLNFCGMSMSTAGSTSMAPTLREKEYLMKKPYGGSRPRRGDIIVFYEGKASTGKRTLYIKRVIGLPGETVELHGEEVVVNGHPFRSEPIDDTAAGSFGNTMTLFKETTPEGRDYTIGFDSEQTGPRSRIEKVTVPPGHFFVLGDNRHNSLDSRFPDHFGDVGFVAAEDVVGRAVAIFASSDETRIGNILK